MPMPERLIGAVREVIAAEGDLLQGDTEPLAEPTQGGELVFTALMNMADAQRCGALAHHGRVTAGNQRDMDADALEQLQAVAILGMKGLDFDAVGLEVKATIGQYAVYVQGQQFYTAYTI